VVTRPRLLNGQPRNTIKPQQVVRSSLSTTMPSLSRPLTIFPGIPVPTPRGAHRSDSLPMSWMSGRKGREPRSAGTLIYWAAVIRFVEPGGQFPDRLRSIPRWWAPREA
jgi:hypothetical protein